MPSSLLGALVDNGKPLASKVQIGRQSLPLLKSHSPAESQIVWHQRQGALPRKTTVRTSVFREGFLEEGLEVWAT